MRTDDLCAYGNQNSVRAQITYVYIRSLRKSEKLGYGLHMLTSEVQYFEFSPVRIDTRQGTLNEVATL
jgi:hypothetical protein